MRYYGEPGIISVSSCGKYYLISHKDKTEINETAAFYWKCLCGGMDENEILEKASDQYEIENPEQFRKDIDQFISSLISAELLHIAE